MAKIVLPENKKTVAETSGIDFVLLMSLAAKDNSDEAYWKKSYVFYCNIIYRYPEELSVKQLQWLKSLQFKLCTKELGLE